MCPCCCGFVYSLITDISNTFLKFASQQLMFIRELLSLNRRMFFFLFLFFFWLCVCENFPFNCDYWTQPVHIVPQITDLRQRLAESQKTVLELEAEREQRQRDYDKKLLLAKSKIENVQVRIQGCKAPQIRNTEKMFKLLQGRCFNVLLVYISGGKGVPQL